MQASVLEQQFNIPIPADQSALLTHLREHSAAHIGPDWHPIRFAVASADPTTYQCEFATLNTRSTGLHRPTHSIFEFRNRHVTTSNAFNVVLLIPTGIGAALGGHAGDAGPVARLLAEVSDTLLLHPNVVNASDLNEMPPNAWYIEGSVLARLLMGTVGLSQARMNRVLVVIDAQADSFFVNAAVNAVSAARASYGLVCPEVVCHESPVCLRSAYSQSGRAGGRVENLEGLCALLDDRAGHYDAVALSSVVAVPTEYHRRYFDSAGEMVNPWGGVEAMLTHAVSTMYNVPTAHSPMFESREIANNDPGIVDPRMAAEAVSTTFLQCILKGLQKSPRIATDADSLNAPGIFTASDISCLVIPEGCLGIPTLAALQQGIPVVAVANENLMTVDLGSLPWKKGQFHRVNNYHEAVGVLAALRCGIECDAVRRPLAPTTVSYYSPPGVRTWRERGPNGSDASVAVADAAKMRKE